MPTKFTGVFRHGMGIEPKSFSFQFGDFCQKPSPILVQKFRRIHCGNQFFLVAFFFAKRPNNMLRWFFGDFFKLDDGFGHKIQLSPPCAAT